MLKRTVEPHLSDAGYPDRPGPSGKFVENSTKLTCLEITGYRIIIIIIIIIILLLLLLLLLIATELSLGGSSPYTSTNKTNKNKYT
jgi:hypothetical protein